jgi:cell division protein FtsQ
MAERRKSRPGRVIVRVLSRVIVLAIVAVVAVQGARKAREHVDLSDFLAVEEIRVKGVRNIDTLRVLELAGVATGTSLLSIKPREISGRIGQTAWANGVRVRRLLPGTVLIAVEERKPIALVNTGEIGLVDPAGVLLPLTAGQYLDLPLFSGLKDTVDEQGIRRLTPESTGRMSRMMETLRQSKALTTGRISQVSFDTYDRIRLRLEALPVVVHIDETRLEESFSRLALLMSMIRSGERQMPHYINLAHANCAYVR